MATVTRKITTIRKSGKKTTKTTRTISGGKTTRVTRTVTRKK
jgi:hypothetical protein